MSAEANNKQLLDLAHRVVKAWNELDVELLRELVDENIQVTHKNRGLDTHGRDNMLAMVSEMAKAFPDRSIGETKRWATTGDSIMRETVWQGTAAFDVPGFGNKGEHSKLEVLSIMSFRDGRLTEWCDYG